MFSPQQIYAPAYRAPAGPRLQIISTSVSFVPVVTQTSTNPPAFITNQIPVVTSALGWPSRATNHFLEYIDGFSPASVWRRMTDPRTLVGNELVVTNQSMRTARFYRLRANWLRS